VNKGFHNCVSAVSCSEWWAMGLPNLFLQYWSSRLHFRFSSSETQVPTELLFCRSYKTRLRYIYGAYRPIFCSKNCYNYTDATCSLDYGPQVI